MKKKKILMLAYYFPPFGGVPVQRTLKFAKYLKKYGWNPLVLTVRNGYDHFHPNDPSLLNKIISIPNDKKNYYFLSLFIFFVLLALPFVKKSYIMYGYKNFTITTDKGSIRSIDDNRTKRFWATVRYLMENTSRDSKVVVFPRGVGINFFSLRNNPLR